MEGELDDAADHLRREDWQSLDKCRRDGVEAAALVLFDAARRGHCMYVQSVRYPYVLVQTSECDAKFRWSTVEANGPLIRFNGTKPWESGAGAQKGRQDAAAIPWAACDLVEMKTRFVRRRVASSRVATRSKERTESVNSPP